MPESSPVARDDAPAEDLRAWADALPVVRFVHAALPRRHDEDLSPARGACVDATRAPWLSIHGELRVSVLRVYCLTDLGPDLVGQLQATEDATALTEKRKLRAYVHARENATTREVQDLDAWWLEILERHYAADGDVVTADATPGFHA